MAKNWSIPTGDDLWQVVSRSVVLKSNEDSAGGSNDSNDLDTGLDSRASKAVDHAVAEVRGAIESAGRYPISVTAAAVPPEGVQHTLALAAWRLVMTKPGLLAIVMGDGGVYAPLNALVKDAKEWMKKLCEGGSFVLPTDPTGVDYLTAVSSSNLAISGIKWGDSVADDAEYDAGITADGIVVSGLTNNMNTQ
jgi:hypothetical protein